MMMFNGKTMRALLRLSAFTALCALLIAAAPIDLTTSESPVADAAMQGERASVRSLLRQGGDVNAAQGDGMTALHWAAVKSDVEMAEMLLYAGANVKATTRLGAYTPLFLAAKSGRPAMIEMLLEARADMNASTTTGATPLMLAAASGSVEAVTLLLDEGADVNATESKRSQTGPDVRGGLWTRRCRRRARRAGRGGRGGDEPSRRPSARQGSPSGAPRQASEAARGTRESRGGCRAEGAEGQEEGRSQLFFEDVRMG